MQLRNIGKSRPIVLAASLVLAGSAFPFSYDALNYSRINSVIQNTETAQYIQNIERNSLDDFLLKMRFQEHLQKWEQKTQFYSIAKKIVKDEDFQAIVAMKGRAVPFIIEEIRIKPSLLVWALNLIYDKKISDNPKMTIEGACKLWLKELKA